MTKTCSGILLAVLSAWIGAASAGVINGSITDISSGRYGNAPYRIVLTSKTRLPGPAAARLADKEP